jgi:protein arginine kinase activator
MLCQKCKKNPAGIHVTRIINNEKTEWYLCFECAKSEQALGEIIPFNVNELINGLVAATQDGGKKQEVIDILCDQCGTSYSEFQKTSKLGCEHCYNAFEKQLKLIIKKVQGSTVHEGKIPQNVGKEIKARREIIELKDQLQRAIATEAFEEAAVFRDKIKKLEAIFTQNREDIE